MRSSGRQSHHWLLAMVLAVGVLFLARPAWEIATEIIGDWRRSRDEAREQARRAKLPKPPPPLVIERDLPTLAAVLDSIKEVRVEVMHAPFGSIASRSAARRDRIYVPVRFDDWWPRFRNGLLMNFMDGFETSTYPIHLHLRCRGSHGDCEIWLGPLSWGSRLEIAWSDSLGKHRLKARPLSMLSDYSQRGVQDLKLGVRID